MKGRKQRIVLVAIGLLVAVLWSGQATAQVEQEQSLFLNLATDDVWRGAMGINFANVNLDLGHPVTIALTVTGVRIAVRDNRIPKHTNAVTGQTPQELLRTAIERGARVLVCRLCLTQAGFRENHLIEGIELVGAGQVAAAMYASDRTLTW